MRTLIFGLVGLALSLSACSDDSASSGGGGSAGSGASAGTGAAGSGGQAGGGAGGTSGGGTGGSGIGGMLIGGAAGMGGGSAVTGEVYAHSADTLYLMEPVSKVLTEVGTFDCISVGDPNDSADGMTDIAIDKNGRMLGVGVAAGHMGAPSHSLFNVDPKTAECTLITALTELYQGLSFVPEGTLEATEEVLVGFGADGSYARFDQTTGAATPIGPLGANWSSKGGDMVAIKGAAMYIMASNGGDDHLVTMDPVTGGVVNDIGDSGLSFGGAGLGYWGGTLYAFAFDGKLYEVDVTTGTPTEVPISGGPAQFRGAGVTTIAPIEPPK